MRALLRLGVRKGLLGGSTPWTYVFVVTGLWRLLRRLTRSEPEVLWCGEVAEGQTLVVDATPAVTRSRR